MLRRVFQSNMTFAYWHTPPPALKRRPEVSAPFCVSMSFCTPGTHRGPPLGQACPEQGPSIVTGLLHRGTGSARPHPAHQTPLPFPLHTEADASQPSLWPGSHGEARPFPSSPATVGGGKALLPLPKLIHIPPSKGLYIGSANVFLINYLLLRTTRPLS